MAVALWQQFEYYYNIIIIIIIILLLLLLLLLLITSLLAFSSLDCPSGGQLSSLAWIIPVSVIGGLLLLGLIILLIVLLAIWILVSGRRRLGYLYYGHSFVEKKCPE